MKKLIYLLFTTVFILTNNGCKKQDIFEEDNINLSIQLNLNIDFSLELDQTTSKSSFSTLKTDSEFNHVIDDELTITFTSDPEGYSNSLTFDPSDSQSTISLPYGNYNWEIESSIVSGTAISQKLPVYGQSSSTVLINQTDVNLDLVVQTDYSLITVNTEHVSSVLLKHDDDSINLDSKVGFFYGYVYSGSTSFTLEVADKEGSTITTTLDSVESCKEYKYTLNYSDVNVNSLVCLCKPFEVVEKFLIPSNNIEVGDSLYGGKVFYLFEEGDAGYVEEEIHGLIVALEDIGETKWLSGDTGNFKTDVTVTDYSDSSGGSDIGKGYDNCENLITYKNDNQLSGSFVAIELATSSELQNYQDWYLPSIGELTLIRNNTELRDAIGFTDGKYYWSSSLMDNKVGAMAINMSVDSNGFCGCSFAEARKVRPIRKF